MAATPERWARVKEVLAEAVDLPADERDAYLLKECSSDDVLAEVRSLLAYEEAELRSGTILKGRYRILNKLADGGFATTFLAVDSQLSDRKVVIKVLRDPKSEPYIQRKFREELHALSILEHPNVIAPLDHGELANGQAFLVTQFAEGRTLRSIFEDGPLSLFRTGELVQQAGRALTFVHAQGVFHRDLKPENIVVQTFADGSEHLRLIDFGIATVLRSVPSTTTQIVGSLSYMAPEQLMGKPTASSDLYSLGVLTYEALTGQLPFSAELPGEHLGLQRGDVVNPAMLRPEIPVAAGELILKALRFKVEERPQDPGRFADELKIKLARADTSRRIRLRRLAFAAPIGVLMVALGVGAWAKIFHRRAAPAADKAALARSLTLAPAAINQPSLTLDFLGHGSRPFLHQDGDVVLASASDFRLAVKASRAAHLYLLSENKEDGSLHLLFPSSTSYGGSSMLAAEQTRLIPEGSAFRFSGDAADETLFIAVSADPIAELESALQWSNNRFRGKIGDPAEREAVRRVLHAQATELVWQGANASLPISSELVVTHLTLRHASKAPGEE